MGVIELKKELIKFDNKQLIELIVDLYKKNKPVAEYLDFYINPNENEKFLQYKQKVFEAFFPKRGYNYSLKDGKKAISDFKKLKPSPDLIADLMLFYVETGVQFTKTYGDINEAFYLSLESVFFDTLELIKKLKILESFDDRCKKNIEKY